jgi:hypothetical protein
MAASLIWTTGGDMRNLKPLEPSVPPLHCLVDASSNMLSLLKFHVAPANCESFLHLIFDRIGGGRGSVCATGHCLTAIFRSELTEGHTPGVTPKCQLRRTPACVRVHRIRRRHSAIVVFQK